MKLAGLTGILFTYELKAHQKNPKLKGLIFILPQISILIVIVREHAFSWLMFKVREVTVLFSFNVVFILFFHFILFLLKVLNSDFNRANCFYILIIKQVFMILNILNSFVNYL